ncbi:phage holin [Phocaeicola sartorii]|uniref:phage holin n=1 Tax=Phocaeicola sartorii TaxID=671267 RepID=UPI00272B56AC|nr:phage holin [Phocaeicola sartorii]
MKRKVEKMTIVRTAVLAFALINQVLTISGYNPLPFTDEDFGQAVSMILTAGASLWAWWKNNSFTQNAIIADEYLHHK